MMTPYELLLTPHITTSAKVTYTVLLLTGKSLTIRAKSIKKITLNKDTSNPLMLKCPIQLKSGKSATRL